MKSSKLFSIVLLGVLLILPAAVFAQTGIVGGQTADSEIGSLMSNILKFIDDVVIPFILSIGFLVFVWGMFQYFIRGGDNDEAKEKGKSLILYAIAGFVVIAAFWGIINIVVNGIGIDDDKLDDTPKANLIN